QRFFLFTRTPPRSTLFPYTTLFRSTTILDVPGRLPAAAGAARHDPRAWALPGRALVRRESRSVLYRLRQGAVRLYRPAGHALESRGAATRRLCPVRRRHESGKPAERGMESSAGGGAIADVPIQAAVAAGTDRGGRSGDEPPASNRHSGQLQRGLRQAYRPPGYRRSGTGFGCRTRWTARRRGDRCI